MAERKIRWTPKALRDQKQIWDYWYKRTGSVDYPIKLQELFNETLTFLALMPQIGLVFDEERNISHAIIKDYKIYYTYSDHYITVVTIWDTRRNPKNLKF